MKKIDLHIHTVATRSDSQFDFCLDKLSEYIDAANLDAIAITNHNIFDATQFGQIRDAVTIPVYAGI